MREELRRGTDANNWRARIGYFRVLLKNGRGSVGTAIPPAATNKFIIQTL
jgi:hypothetical protein